MIARGYKICPNDLDPVIRVIGGQGQPHREAGHRGSLRDREHKKYQGSGRSHRARKSVGEAKNRYRRWRTGRAAGPDERNHLKSGARKKGTIIKAAPCQEVGDLAGLQRRRSEEQGEGGARWG